MFTHTSKEVCYDFYVHFCIGRNEARETHTSKEVCYDFYVHFFIERNEPKNNLRGHPLKIPEARREWYNTNTPKTPRTLSHAPRERIHTTRAK